MHSFYCQELLDLCLNSTLHPSDGVHILAKHLPNSSQNYIVLFSSLQTLLYLIHLAELRSWSIHTNTVFQLIILILNQHSEFTIKTPFFESFATLFSMELLHLLSCCNYEQAVVREHLAKTVYPKSHDIWLFLDNNTNF